MNADPTRDDLRRRLREVLEDETLAVSQLSRGHSLDLGDGRRLMVGDQAEGWTSRTIGRYCQGCAVEVDIEFPWRLNAPDGPTLVKYGDATSLWRQVVPQPNEQEG